MIRTLVFLAPFSPVPWRLEQGYLDLKECSDSCETEKSYPHSLQRPLVHLNRNVSLIYALYVIQLPSPLVMEDHGMAKILNIDFVNIFSY